eukprot:TRINITY_DN2236_c0_g1_i2.p1 TRINITY_DN2236_c0_g1~~TRINITY_DN2236_c0_g1_i2.p1  ORF type:complete len:1490 (+),score=291.76 TRINITY_DN2236_c0_g1_i2:40-4470(+)
MSTQELCDAAFQGALTKIKSLLKTMPLKEINGKNNRGQTALYCSSRAGHLEIVKELLKVRDIDVDAQEPRGSTALHAASFAPHPQILALLLSYGCSTTITNNPVGESLRGLTAREEARGESREIWKLWEEGGNALELKFPFIKRTPRKSIPSQIMRTSSIDLTSSGSGSSKGRRRSNIPQECILKEGTLQLRDKNHNWKTREVVFFKQLGNRIAWYKKEKEGGKEKLLGEVTIPTIEQAGSITFGITQTKDCDPTCTFFVRGRQDGGDVNSPVMECIFKAEDFNQRQSWLTSLYEGTVRDNSSSLNISTVDKNQYLKEWGEYATKGYFEVDSHFSSTRTREEELNILVKQIEEITKEDVYHTCIQDLNVSILGMPRGSELREQLLEITKAPRPYDMCNWNASGEDILKPIRDFRSRIASTMLIAGVNEQIMKALKKFDDLYLTFLNSKGSQPKQAFLRTGNVKIGSRIVPRQVIDVIKDPNANTEEGIHRVVRIGNVFLKINPSAPAYEIAVGELTEVIWHQGTVITLIVKIELPDSSCYVCQAASAVEGVLLRDFVKEAPQLVQYLDHANLTLHYIAATLYRPLDGKLDNLIVTCKHYGEDKKKLVLVSIDSDEAFADEFTRSGMGFHDLSVRFCVWLLPYLNQAINLRDHQSNTSSSSSSQHNPQVLNKNNKHNLLHHHAIQEMVSLSAEYVVVHLLCHLYKYNQRMFTLYERQIITKDELLGSLESNTNPLIALFRPREMIRLLEDTRRVREILSESLQSETRSLTFTEFLDKALPTVSKLYNYATTKITSDTVAFEGVVQTEIFGFGKPAIEKMIEVNEMYPTLKEEIKKYSNKAFSYFEDRKSRPEVELEILLPHIDFSTISDKDHDSILWMIVKIPLRYVTITNSHLFGRKHLEALIEHGSVEKLTLEKCSLINDSIINVLQIICGQQRVGALNPFQLHLIGCPVSADIAQTKTNSHLVIKSELSVYSNTINGDVLSKFRQKFDKYNNVELKTIFSNLRIPASDEEVGKIVKFLDEVQLSDNSKHLVVEALSEHQEVPLVCIEYSNCYPLLVRFHKLMGDQFAKSGWKTFLEHSLAYLNEKAAVFLLTCNPDIEVTQENLVLALKSKMTSLSLTILNKHQDYFKVPCDDNNNTSLMLIMNHIPSKDLDNLIDLVIQKAPSILNNLNKDGQNVLHFAVKLNNINYVKLLIKSGVDINVKDKNGTLPIHIAILSIPENKDSMDIVKLLIESGCLVDFNALAHMCGLDDLACLRMTLEMRKDINEGVLTDNLGQSLLHLCKNLPAVDFILNRSIHLAKVPDNNGETPIFKFLQGLATANIKKNQETHKIISSLVENGSDINKFNHQGYTVLHMSLIRKIGGNKHLPILVMSLIELGSDIFLNPEKDPKNMNTLHLACATGIIQVVRQICHHARKKPKKLKVLIEGLTSDRFSSIQIAQQYGNDEMVKYLSSVKQSVLVANKQKTESTEKELSN